MKAVGVFAVNDVRDSTWFTGTADEGSFLSACVAGGVLLLSCRRLPACLRAWFFALIGGFLLILLTPRSKPPGVCGASLLRTWSPPSFSSRTIPRSVSQLAR